MSVRLLTTMIFLVVLFSVLSFIKPMLWPFILAAVLAYIFDPMTTAIERFVRGRSLASFVTVAIFSAVVGLFLSILLPILLGQLVTVVEKFPQALDALQLRLLALDINIPNWVSVKEKIMLAIHNIDTSALRIISGNAQTIFTKISGVANEAFFFMLALIMMFYLLKDFAVVRNTFIKAVPLRHHADMLELTGVIDKSVAGFLRGQLTVMFILGAWYAVALSLIGLENAVAIGVMTGIVVFIPYVGALIGVCTATLFGVSQFADFGHIFLIWSVYGFGQTVESFILTPNIVGNKVGLPAVWMMFALMAGAALFGFIGVLLAVPTAAAIGATIRFCFAKYLKTEFYKR